jgi:hypothetical protein
MSDETELQEPIAPEAEAPPASEPSPEKPDTEALAPETEPDQEGEAGAADPEGEGSEPEPPESETVEIEFDGERYAVPKTLEKAFMQQADYTRKTQEVAEQRRATEELNERLQQTQQATAEEMQMRTELMSINQQLEQASGIDWNAYWDQNPVEAGKAQGQVNSLNQRQRQLEHEIGQAEFIRTETAKQEAATRLRSTMNYARTKIPGWSNDVHDKMQKFATENLGYTPQQIVSAMNPAIYRTLHLAMIGHEAMTKQSAKPKPAPAVEPLKKITGKTGRSARKSIAQMSMDEYAEYRNQQEKAEMRKSSR